MLCAVCNRCLHQRLGHTNIDVKGGAAPVLLFMKGFLQVPASHKNQTDNKIKLAEKIKQNLYRITKSF